MSRDSQGVYSLPAGNPVTPGTVIEADWANTTMDDIAVAITDSLPRNGSAPMTGPLTLPATDPTNLNQAVRKGYVDKFLSLSTGLPIGGVLAFASNETPGGFLLCNGQSVSRSTYSELFAIIGTIYGSGDSVSTFNVPDLRGEFIRGRDSSRALGSKQVGAIESHSHALNDPGHLHPLTDPGHTHSSPAHTHGVTDPGHIHTLTKNSTANVNSQGSVGYWNAGGDLWGTNLANPTNSASTGISINQAAVAINGSTTGVQSASATTGASVGASGSTETRPQNVAMDYYIKAINNTAAAAPVTITSGDTAMLIVDDTIPTMPVLNLIYNIPFGTVKLDGNGKLPMNTLPTSAQSYLGTFDASGGLNPSEAFPATTFSSGDTFLISTEGTINVFDPDTKVSAPTLVESGWYLVYDAGGVNPLGWYFISTEALAVIAAVNVGIDPIAGLAATNVQVALEVINNKVVTDGDKGDVVVSSGGSVWNVESVKQNLTFLGTAARITGDFSNTTEANRALTQTSTLNAATNFGVIPNGSSVVSTLSAYSASDPTNSSIARMTMTGLETRFLSTITGTGTYLPMTFYTGGSERMRIDTSGNVLVTAAAGLGYGAGAGGTVTQATDKTTPVTINKPCGQIITSNSALAAGARTAFTVNNSICQTGDVPTVAVVGNTNYLVQTHFTANGNFSIAIENITAGSLSQALTINFAIIKGSST